MERPSDAELSAAIADAARQAFAELFQTGEHFYYCTLITTGEALPPFVAAWSHEALERCVEPQDRDTLKWSYADSPYCAFGWEEYFGTVRRMFQRLPDLHTFADSDWEAEYEARLNVMETAMRTLDTEGLFGAGKNRLNMVVNVEVMPPDHANTLRAFRLNPPAALTAWLAEAAEPAE